jgi:hypothetical protein
LRNLGVDLIEAHKAGCQAPKADGGPAGRRTIVGKLLLLPVELAGPDGVLPEFGLAGRRRKPEALSTGGRRVANFSRRGQAVPLFGPGLSIPERQDPHISSETEPRILSASCLVPFVINKSNSA